MAPRTVLLFRAPNKPADSFEQLLLEDGYAPVSIPVLQFNYLNLELLADCLGNSDDYCSIVFTSQRSVEAVDKALSLDTGLETGDCTSTQLQCLDMPCYVVGGSTCKAASHVGFKPEETYAGNADKLADSLIKILPQTSRPVLYPCGNLRKETLGVKLRQAGFDVKEIEVYETGRNTDLETKVENHIKTPGIPEYCVFFSPSGVQFTSALVASGILPLDKMKLIAIGPSTEKELTAAGLDVYGVATKPDPAGVLAAMNKS